MRLLLVLLFIVAPLVELVVIIQVGQVIGVWWTLGLLIADSLIGAWLLGRESRHVWSRFRQALTDGRWPGDEVAQGALVLVGGTLLLTPGFVTDIIGFTFLLRPTRAVVSRVLRTLLTPTAVRQVRTVGGAAGAAGAAAAGTGSRRAARDAADDQDSGEILDIEVVEIVREDGTDATSGRAEPPELS